MHSRTRITALALAAGALLAAWSAAGPAMGQDKPKKDSRWAPLLDVNLMVETYSTFLVRKYDLNDEQAEFTHKMLQQKAEQFMSVHGDQVRGLVERMFDVRTGAEMAPTELMEWGKNAAPIYEEAKQIIVSGNSEWREILNDQQKAIHDEDLKLMTESFNSTEDQLGRIVSGEMTVDEFRKPQRNSAGGKRAGGERHGRNKKTPAEPPPPPPPAQVAEQAITPADEQAGVMPPGETPVAAQQQITPPVQPPGPEDGEIVVGQTHDGPQVTTAVPPGENPPGVPHVRHRPGGVVEQPVEHGPETPGDGAPEIVPPDQQEPPQDGQDPPPVQPAPEEQPVAEPPVVQPPVGHEGPAPQPPRDSAGVRRSDGPTMKAGLEFEGKWDAYVRDFIQRYKLNDAQTQKANDILKDCKGQASQYLKSKAGRLKEIDEKLGGSSAAARGAAAAPHVDKKKDEKGAKDQPKPKIDPSLAEERAKLIAPIDEIFEKRLKPRLDSLPTRAQRAAAESPKSPSKPGATTGAGSTPPAAGAAAKDWKPKKNHAEGGKRP